MCPGAYKGANLRTTPTARSFEIRSGQPCNEGGSRKLSSGLQCGILSKFQSQATQVSDCKNTLANEQGSIRKGRWAVSALEHERDSSDNGIARPHVDALCILIIAKRAQ